MYKKEKRRSIATVKIIEGKVALEDQIFAAALKEQYKGRGIRLRGRKPIPGTPPYSYGRTSWQDLPLRYAQEADIYSR